MPHHTPTATPTPFWAVQAFSFLNSVGTATVTTGIYYITDSGYGFSRSQNLALGVALGITYIIGAFFAGPLLRRLQLRHPWLSGRRVLVGLMIGLAVLCLLPMLTAAAGFPPQNRSVVGIVVIWIMIVGYSPLTGVLWPMVESYVSGARSGHDLRRVMGNWNVCWSSAGIFAQLAMGPLLKDNPDTAIYEPNLILAGTAVIHLAAASILASFPAEPPPHIEEHHEPHPPVYTKLLVTFRMLIPMSYVMLSGLTPILTTIFESLGVEPQHRPWYGTAWIIPRVLMFWVLAHWHGWEGRWWAAVVGGVVTVLGFGAAVTAPLLAQDKGALYVTLAGLGVFGAGMALIYTAALYYAMEVGKAGVDAGGMHEALIGIGYTVGPGCGLAAQSAVSLGAVSAGGFGPVLFGLVGVLSVGTTGLVIHRVWKLSTVSDVPETGRPGAAAAELGREP